MTASARSCAGGSTRRSRRWRDRRVDRVPPRLRGADDVVLADVGEIAGGATGRRWAASASSSRPGRGAAGEGERAALRRARRAALRAGRISLPRDDGAGARARGAPLAPGRARSPVERVEPARSRVSARTTCSERRSAARTGSPIPPASRSSSCGARPIGSRRPEHTDALALDADMLVVACGRAPRRSRRNAASSCRSGRWSGSWRTSARSRRCRPGCR